LFNLKKLFAESEQDQDEQLSRHLIFQVVEELQAQAQAVLLAGVVDLLTDVRDTAIYVVRWVCLRAKLEIIKPQ